jgi:hypothetical protein
MADPASSDHVIADRYLTSPSALALHPFGPVDALDTRSGRGAQVRIVLVDGGWEEAALADAVARWCGIGCSEVCGVLDFGRHGDRWFLVLPPSLGLPVERWRMLRRPAAGDAARLALAFGRLAERVAAAGFSPDLAVLADVAVGPGPTPFLERPLLQPPDAGTPVTGDGQRVLAAVCAAALGPLTPPPELGAWLERAGAGAFPRLPDCLDELERCGAPDEGADPDARPPGLERLFDEQFDLDGLIAAPPDPGRRRLLAAVPIAVVAVAGALLLLGHGAHRSAAAEPPPQHPAARVTPVATTPAAPEPARRQARRTSASARTHHAPKQAHHHRATTPPPRTQTTTTTPPPDGTTATTTPPTTPPPTTPPPPPSTGAVELPIPGGTTLPAP